MRGQFWFVWFTALVFSVPALAQPKPGYEPSSTHIFPAGGQRGTTVDVLVGTECFPPGSRFSVVGEGASAPALLGDEVRDCGHPSPRRPPTETPITYPRQWRSQIRIDSEARLGAAFWRLSCAQGGTTSRPFVIGDLPEFVEAEPNSTIRVAEQVALPITVNGQVHGERDVDYFRFAVTKGQVVRCDVMARRLGSRLDPIVRILDSEGQAVRAELAHIGSDPQLRFVAEADGEYLLRVANVTFHGSPAHVYRINLMLGSATGPDVELAEGEPNDRAEEAVQIPESTRIDGAFASPRDEDWFALSVERGQWFSIDCAAFPRGTSALPTLAIIDERGQRLQSARGVETEDGLCRIEWQAPASGRFLLRLRDTRFGARGGDEFRYRLAVQPSTPRFELSLKSDSINVVQGGQVDVEVVARRYGGFEGEIQLSVEGLPDGVTIDGSKIAAKATTTKLKFTASDDSRAVDSRLRISGRAQIGEQQIDCVARADHLGTDEEGISVGPSTVDAIHLTVCHKPVFRLFCSEHYQYAHRGTVYPYLMEIERLNGFTEDITLQIGDRQNRDVDGIEFHQVVVPGTESSGLLPIYLPETMYINIQSQSQLYAQGYAAFVDRHGSRQTVLVLSEKRNMLRTMPPVVKLESLDEQITTKPGGEFVCRLHLKRTSNFLGPMNIELLDAGEGFESRPTSIGQRKSAARVTVRAAEQIHRGAQTKLRFRATGKLKNGTTVISEASVPVIVE